MAANFFPARAVVWEQQIGNIVNVPPYTLNTISAILEISLLTFAGYCIAKYIGRYAWTQYTGVPEIIAGISEKLDPAALDLIFLQKLCDC